MSKAKVLLLVVFILKCLSPFAQVNLQTGSATFSLPMFNWQDNKSRLNAVVALSYNSGNGLKVNDVASNVGQGWNLIAGGVITRLQLGEPDDQPSRGTGEAVDQYPPGFLYATIPAKNGCPKALTTYPIYNPMNTLYAQHNVTAEDKQIDYFSFQFNGKAGVFVLDVTNKGDIGAVLGDSKMKITFTRDATMINQGIRTTITSFTIQDTDGLLYKFSQHGLTKILKSDYCDANFVQQLAQPKFNGGSVYHQYGFDGQITYPYTIGSWYLSEIKDPFTNRVITFNYASNNNIATPAGDDITYNQDKDYSVISHKKSVSITPVLSSISFPDSHAVTFNYGNNRFDLINDKVLASVDIKYGIRSLSQYQLNTSYFILNRYGTPVNAFQKGVARLCLKSVRKIGVDLKEDSPPYIFDYYMGSGVDDDFVPPAFCYTKDVWGFYNGNNSKAFDNITAIPILGGISQLDNNQLKGLCFLHTGVTRAYFNTKLGYAKNGLLKQIVYPTGGTLTYQYAQNTGNIDGIARTVGGVHVSSTSSTDGGYSNGCSNPIVANYNYVLTDATSSLWGLEMPVNYMSMSSHWEPEQRGFHIGITAITGTCYWEYSYPGILMQSQSISLTDFQKFMNTMAPVLGVISIVTTVLDIVNVCLDGTPLCWVAIILDIIGGIVTYIFSCRKNAKDDNTTIYYNSDLNGISPMPAQFKRVEVIDNPGTIGKTVHEFTSSDDYIVWYPTNDLFSPKQRFAPWAYGLLKKNTVYDASGNKVKEIENIYDFTKSRRFVDLCVKECIPYPDDYLETRLIGCKCQVKHSTSQRNTDWGDPSKYNNDTYQTGSSADLGAERYGLYTGRTELQTSYERLYKSGSSTAYTETKTDYTYNDDEGYNFELRGTSTKLSNGDIIYKDYYYLVGYVSPMSTLLMGNNVVTLPSETDSYITKASGTSGYISDNQIEYIQTATGDIKPWRTSEKRFSSPGNTNGTFVVTQTNTYNSVNNLVGVKDEGGRLIANIYDYDDKYIVASVINADALVDKPVYTSFETTNSFGGWTFSGAAAFDNTKSITGTQSFILSAGKSFTAVLNNAKAYIVSFWSTSAGVSVSSSTLSKTGPTINGFTYYEYAINAGTSSTTVSGSSTIDELRCYPKNARMRTVTYDPLIGKTSECDENNRVVYYEYDNLGRLQLEKDENKNIVKMHEYNNISPAKQFGCPGVYKNTLISEKFTKSNCAAGYAGKDIAYSVPANKYTSAFSQADADAQAENELFASGQTNADNATAATGCVLINYNTIQTQDFTSQGCDLGYVGGTVTYIVPANKYASLLSIPDANQQALNEIAANGQLYANSISHRNCIVNNQPDWFWKDTDPNNKYCLTVNGVLPAHQFVLLTDLNPNSPSYNQTQWRDIGVQDDCPGGTYYNAQQSGSFTKYCAVGGPGSTVVYTVKPGKYSSTTSQAAADLQATNEVNANGQAYANSVGVCCSPGFTWTGGLSSPLVNVAVSGAQVTFTLVVTNYPATTGIVTLGNLTGNCCFPTGTRTVPFLNGSTLFNIIISSTGLVQAQYVSGPTPSSSAGFHGVFDLLTNGFYSAAKSGSYQRTNCPTGQVGSYVTYNIPAFTYFSTVNQTTVDQQAQSACDSYGPTYANNNGTCSLPSVPCSFGWASGVSGYGATVSVSGTTVTFQLTFPSPNSSYSGGTIGTITGGCLPSVIRSFHVNDGATSSRIWNVTISTSGVMSMTLYSGSPATNTGPPIVLSGTFSL